MSYDVRIAGRDGAIVSPPFDDPLSAIDYAKAQATRDESQLWVWRSDDNVLLAECDSNVSSLGRTALLDEVNGQRGKPYDTTRTREFRARREHCEATGDLHDWRGTGAEFRCAACRTVGYASGSRIIVRRCQAMRWHKASRRMKRCCSELATHMHTTKRGMCRQYAVCAAHRRGLYESKVDAA